MRTMEVRWTGADGSEWDLTSWNSTVQLVAAELPGMPSFTQQFAVSGARDGRRYEGTAFQESTATLTVSVGDLDPLPGRRRRRTGEEWRALDRAWRKSLSAIEQSVLTVVTATTTRRMRLRLAQPPIIPSKQDPALIGEATYTYVLTADDQPWWEGDPISPEWAITLAPKPFFSGGDGNRLYISSANRLAESSISNPGDRETYPLWWARGPFVSVTVGIGDQLVTLPFSRAENEYVFVNSAEQTIVDQNGDSLWPLMGFTDPTFAPIPPNLSDDPDAEIELVTSLDTAGLGAAIGVSITPLYGAPW